MFTTSCCKRNHHYSYDKLKREYSWQRSYYPFPWCRDRKERFFAKYFKFRTFFFIILSRRYSYRNMEKINEKGETFEYLSRKQF